MNQMIKIVFGRESNHIVVVTFGGMHYWLSFDSDRELSAFCDAFHGTSEHVANRKDTPHEGRTFLWRNKYLEIASPLYTLLACAVDSVAALQAQGTADSSSDRGNAVPFLKEAAKKMREAIIKSSATGNKSVGLKKQYYSHSDQLLATISITDCIETQLFTTTTKDRFFLKTYETEGDEEYERRTHSIPIRRVLFERLQPDVVWPPVPAPGSRTRAATRSNSLRQTPY